MADIKIEIVHYNRKRKEIDFSLDKNQIYIKDVVKKVINEALLK